MTQPAGFSEDKARIYDQHVLRMIPGYSVLHRMTGVILANELPKDASILVAGSGTGTEILDWAAEYPGWRFTAVEPSAPMVALAQEKLKSYSSRITFKTGTVQQLPEDSSFDAATLILVLHFLTDDDKAELLSAIVERLKPGAPFILANRFGNVDSTRFKKMLAINKAWAIAQGMSVSEAEERFSPNRKDLYDPSEETVKQLLTEAGFIDVQRFYQAMIIGGWMCRAPR